jgi:type II secretory pathway pseudopilin PulG
VNKREANSKPQRGIASGFSLVESMVVLMVGIIIAAAAVIQLNPMLQETRANTAADQVKSTLRLARETAVSARRTVVVQFTNPNKISLYELTPGSSVLGAPILTQVLEGNAQFMTFSGEKDTPDGFSPTITVPHGIFFAGVDGGPTGGMEFQSDGTFTNSTGNPISGTVFVGESNFTASMRAITVMGYTGRVRMWRSTGKMSTTGWIQ